MRKAGLLGKKPLTATRRMLETAKKDTGTERRAGRWDGIDTYTEYESRYYFRAMTSANREILEVDLFTRRDLAFGRKDPRFRIFLDREKKDFASWDMVHEKWSSAKIDMLETCDDRYSYSYRGRNHASKETLGMVNRYLYTGCMNDVETAVLDFQAGIRKTELSQKHRLVTDAIDSYMDMVPDSLPADWMKFVNDRVLEHSVFYTKETRTGYCTHCRLHVPVPDGVRHGQTGRCRQCGCSATYRSWKKQQHTEYRTTAAILQKCTDGVHYVYRQFRVAMSAYRKDYYVPGITLHEDQRVLFVMGRMQQTMRIYEWGQFRYTGIRRWCEGGTVNRYRCGCGNYGYADSVLYTGNIKKLLKGTPLQYVPAAEIVKGMGTERINVMRLLDDMETGFPYEAFWKMGLRRFVRERIAKDFGNGLAEVSRPQAGMKPWTLLGMTKENIRQAARLDATDQQVRIIQKAAGMGVCLEDRQVEWFDRHTGVHCILDYINVQTPNRIIRYLRVQTDAGEGGSCGEFLRLWTDYLDMARRLGWDLHDRSVFFPQDMTRAHDEAAAVLTAKEDRADAERMRAKDDIMRRKAAEIRKAFCYSDDDFLIKVPECYLDFKHEGHAQHNCVATYYDRVLGGRCIILFIRRRQEPDRSFCTVEIQEYGGGFRVVQNRTAYNREAPEGVRVFLEKAVREARKTADRMMKKQVEIRVGTAG